MKKNFFMSILMALALVFGLSYCAANEGSSVVDAGTGGSSSSSSSSSSSGAATAGQVIITEIMGSANGQEDWVELYNTTGMELSIAGFLVADAGKQQTVATGVTLAANAYGVVYLSNDGVCPVSISNCLSSASTNSPGISGSGEALDLKAADAATIIDSVPSLGAFTAGKTKSLDNTKLNATDNDTTGNWADATNVYDNSGPNNGTPGNANTYTSPTYTIGGTVSGQTGAFTLQNNAGNDVNLTSSDASFTFATAVTSYNVTVKTQPSGQVCTVTNGSGTATANVTNVTVNCETPANAQKGDLKINEVNSNGGTDYIEIFNTTASTKAIEAGKWFLADAGLIGTPASYFDLSTFSASITANGFLALDSGAANSFSFGLGNGDAVYLLYYDGTNYHMADSIVFAADVTPAQRSVNGAGVWQTGGTPSKGASNTGNGTAMTTANPTDIKLNEINSNGGSTSGATLGDGQTSAGSEDFVELYNVNSQAYTIPATTLYLLDNAFATSTMTNEYAVAGSISGTSVYTLEKVTNFSFGLGSADSAYLLFKAGSTYIILDSYSWSSHVTSAFRSPNGTGVWSTGVVTFNAAN